MQKSEKTLIQSQGFELIRRLELHVNSLSEAHIQDKKKHFQKLERELKKPLSRNRLLAGSTKCKEWRDQLPNWPCVQPWDQISRHGKFTEEGGLLDRRVEQVQLWALISNAGNREQRRRAATVSFLHWEIGGVSFIYGIGVRVWNREHEAWYDSLGEDMP